MIQTLHWRNGLKKRLPKFLRKWKGLHQSHNNGHLISAQWRHLIVLTIKEYEKLQICFAISVTTCWKVYGTQSCTINWLTDQKDTSCVVKGNKSDDKTDDQDRIEFFYVNRKFKQRCRLVEHVNTHYNYSYTCPVCSKSFDSKSYLVKHQACHDNNKQYVSWFDLNLISDLTFLVSGMCTLSESIFKEVPSSKSSSQRSYLWQYWAFVWMSCWELWQEVCKSSQIETPHCEFTWIFA